MINLKNDYNVLACDEVLERLLKFKDEKNIGYGEDYHTKNVNELVKKMCCNENVETYILSGGTQANIVGLCQMMPHSYEAVVCTNEGHINVHETQAIEASGHKIIQTKSKNGLLDVLELKRVYELHNNNYHMAKIKAVYISNSTEIGTVYKLKDLEEISKFCKEHNLYLFLDGARLPIALTSSENDIALSDIARLCDMFYIGGTKNGALYGECLVIVNDDLKENIKYLIKNKLALFAKGFAGAIMFEALFENDTYLTLAKHANEMAASLREAFFDKLVYKNPTNQVFIKLKNEEVKSLKQFVEVEDWEYLDGYTVIRLTTSFKTTKDEINEVIKLVNNI